MDPKQRKREKERSAKARSSFERRVRDYWKKHRPTPNSGLSQSRLAAAQKFKISVVELNNIVRTDEMKEAAKAKADSYRKITTKLEEQGAILREMERMRTVPHHFECIERVFHPHGRCAVCGLTELYLVHEKQQLRLA